MIIDFHTHIFPDQIAAKTIEKLQSAGGTQAYTNGTLDGLKKSMKESDITLSVILPVVTKPLQFETINDFAEKITDRKEIFSFGGIHPDTEDYRGQLEEIKRKGLLGIKLHPDYQNTFVDAPEMVRMIQYASELGLIVLIHAGLDIGLPTPIHCTPQRAANMLSQIEQENAKIILAHMGGYHLWDEVEEYIVGKNVWVDTSYSLGMMKEEQFVRIVKNHGSDKVLFGTDSPWAGQKETLEYIKRLDLTEEELDRILYRNGAKLLGIG